MTPRHEIEKLVIDIVCEQLGVCSGEVSPASDLRTDLRAGSLDRTEIFMAVEEEYGITITPRDSNGLRTIKDVVDYLVSREV